MNKTILAVVANLVFCTSMVFAGPTKFTAEDAKDPGQFAKKNLKVQAKKLSKLGVKKIVILECYG